VRNFFSSVLANNQKGFGVAIKTWLGASAAEKNTRESLFICGSVNTGNGCSGAADCKTQTAAGCASNLQDTALEYLDMIMLDYPAGDCDSIVGQWEAFEDMLKAGKVRVEGGRGGGGGGTGANVHCTLHTVHCTLYTAHYAVPVFNLSAFDVRLCVCCVRVMYPVVV